MTQHKTTAVDQSPASTSAVPLTIELFALDTEHCSPCRSAVRDVEEAAAELTRRLDRSAYAVSTRIVHLTSAEQARRLGIVSSPTVRVNGRDVALGVEEHACGTCSDLAKAPVSCRTYLWQAERYDHPPVALIVAAVREHVQDADHAFWPYRGEAWTLPSITSIDRFFGAAATPR